MARHAIIGFSGIKPRVVMPTMAQMLREAEQPAEKPAKAKPQGAKAKRRRVRKP